ncbi:BCNT-C domain containing protein [Cryptosporidium hominis]|uniref:BCNT-C domain containing protein n=1 Tax=Cryptosporidium hominis TaxID=237895 RepID=A0ABX5BE37_CRYHO|nr:BCNT-C domain containing protein [Cryptosporidium hominis]|eukprot:PPS96378.1 BCNT-C domain containing protein [Cryptosporidium hominis]
MATINNAVFLSDDEEDESFHGSDASSIIEGESSEEEVSSSTNRKSKKSSLKDVINDRKVEKIYKELLEESRKEFQERVSTVSKDHFMLEFQKKCFDPLRKKNSNLHELRHYVDLGISKVFENPINFDISKFKISSRNLSKESEEETRRMIEEALGSLEEKGVRYIDKKVKYAGETYTIKEKVDPKTFSRKKARTSSTGMQALDEIVANLNKEININSIQKSHSDWTEFRQMAGLESQLERQRKHGYISKTAFLQKADWKLHEKELEIKRRSGGNNNIGSSSNASGN